MLTDYVYKSFYFLVNRVVPLIISSLIPTSLLLQQKKLIDIGGDGFLMDETVMSIKFTLLHNLVVALIGLQ
jgi:hypothetical protein